MKDSIKIVGMLAAVCGLFILGGLLRLGYYQFFAPREEAIRREVWEETRSFRNGSRKELVRYMAQYYSAKDDDAKDAIASAVRLFATEVPLSDGDAEIAVFVNECYRRGR